MIRNIKNTEKKFFSKEKVNFVESHVHDLKTQSHNFSCGFEEAIRLHYIFSDVVSYDFDIF